MEAEETYILLLLSDSNLPTGSFVASAGLESYATHGFLTLGKSNANDALLAVRDYVRDSLCTYARSALPFVSDAHAEVQKHISATPGPRDVESTLRTLLVLDELYDTMTLNHVARRASQSQGVALLNLYSKGFSEPSFLERTTVHSGIEVSASSVLVDKLKLIIRRGDTPGHLPICWGVLTAALDLSAERSRFLHLFLHARSLLSAAVRMNVIGPYASQQLLLHTVHPIVAAETGRCRELCTGLYEPDAQDVRFTSDEMLDEDTTTDQGPAMTWPLGEILATRHDLQHSRVFNS